jgi:hypothetical protein
MVGKTDIPLAPAMRPCATVGRLEYFIIRMMAVKATPLI